jgi:hypothetical protein
MSQVGLDWKRNMCDCAVYMFLFQSRFMDFCMFSLIVYALAAVIYGAKAHNKVYPNVIGMDSRVLGCVHKYTRNVHATDQTTICFRTIHVKYYCPSKRDYPMEWV